MIMTSVHQMVEKAHAVTSARTQLVHTIASVLQGTIWAVIPINVWPTIVVIQLLCSTHVHQIHTLITSPLFAAALQLVVYKGRPTINSVH